MASLKELSRLVNGLSLVAKEIARRSQLVETTRKGDVEGLFRSTAKNALVSATDLVGLTSGKVREFSEKIKPQESIVYFENAPETSQPILDQDQTPLIGSEISNSNVKIIDGATESSNSQNTVARDEIGFRNQSQFDGAAVSALPMESIPQSLGENVNLKGEGGTPETTAVPLKRRKPRERKVPSTPFSRAMGLVFNFTLQLSAKFFVVHQATATIFIH